MAPSRFPFASRSPWQFRQFALSNQNYPGRAQNGDRMVTAGGQQVSSLPRHQVHFSRYTTPDDHSPIKSIRANGKHIFFKTTPGR